MKHGAEKSFIRKHLVDIIVISLLLLISVAVLVVSELTRTEGAYIEIEIDGNIVGKYPLYLDGVYTLNDGTNTLTVEGGVAYMSYSVCPDHTCENTGKIKYVGQAIVCLPNHLTITVVGETDGSVDFVS